MNKSLNKDIPKEHSQLLARIEQIVRRSNFFRHKTHRRPQSSGDVTLKVDGLKIVDVAALYLEFGNVLEPEFGYFGSCLDSLNDCLFGGMGGIAPPFVISVVNEPDLESILDWKAWLQYHATKLFIEEEPSARLLIENGWLSIDNYQEGYRRLQAIASGESVHCNDAELLGYSKSAYWPRFVEVLESHGIDLCIP